MKRGNCVMPGGRPTFSTSSPRWKWKFAPPGQTGFFTPTTTWSSSDLPCSVQPDDAFDAGIFAKQQFLKLVDGVTASDEGAKGIGPALFKQPQIANGPFKGRLVGVDGAEHDLIFQHQIAHQAIRFDRDGWFLRRDAS